MKVLQITPAFYPAYVYGGPIECVYLLSRQLVHHGCEVWVLTTDANGPDKVLDVAKDREVELAKDLRVRYCRRVMRHTVSPALLRAIPPYVRRVDLVHLTAVYSFPTIPTLIVCRVLGKPVVWSPHGSLQRWKGSRRSKLKAFWEWVCRAVAPKTLMLHTTSEQEAQAARERFPDADVMVIPNCVQIPEQVTHVEGRGMLRLLYLGRLDPKKGIENLLQACKILNRNYGEAWSLTIAGAGDRPYTESLRDRIAVLSLQQQVRMIGEVAGDAKERLFEKADIVVVPSFTENFGLVVAEALAHEVPVIASRGTPWSRLEEMGCGLWVNNDPESLAKAIERISRLPRREMGQRGREWMRAEFSWDHGAREMLSCYKRLVG